MTFADSSVQTLLEMLTYKRPHNSKAEIAFIKRYIAPFDPHVDDYGNLWVEIGDDPQILWSSHTDTVHHYDGRQKVMVDTLNIASIDHRRSSGMGKTNCLGADCTAGVWLMCEMIKHKVPGLYVFHRDEESGGKGSSWIAQNTPDMLEGIKFAIALDRKGTGDIITHQGQRTASDAFAHSLALILGGDYEPDDTGLFTDTANYTDLIGECSNISVGYYMNHGPRESLDVDFLVGLRDTLITADFSSLVAEREPGDFDIGAYKGWTLSTPASDSRFNLIDFVRHNPSLVADFLECRGYTLDDLQDFDEHWR